MTTNPTTVSAGVELPQHAIRGLFVAADERDVERTVAFLDPEIEFRFANAEPVHGIDEVRAGITEFNASIAAIHHRIESLWVVDNGGVVITVLDVHYTRLDGTQLNLPCCNVFGLGPDMKVRTYRIFMNIDPVFAP